jgi:hypothetical protein
MSYPRAPRNPRVPLFFVSFLIRADLRKSAAALPFRPILIRVIRVYPWLLFAFDADVDDPCLLRVLRASVVAFAFMPQPDPCRSA